MKREIDIKEIQKLDYGMLLEIKRICEAHNLKYYLAYGTALGCVRHKGFIPWDYDADVVLPIKSYLEFYEIAKKELDPKYEIISGFDSDFPEYFMRMILANQKKAEVYVDLFFFIGAPTRGCEQYKLYKKLLNLQSLRYYRFNNKVAGDSPIKSMTREVLSLVVKTIPLGLLNKRFFRISKQYDCEEAKYVYCPFGRYDLEKPRFFPKYAYGNGVDMQFCDTTFKIPSKYDYYLIEYYNNYMQYPPQEDIERDLAKKTIIEEI